MKPLADRKCRSCESGKGRLSPAEAEELRGQLNPSWHLVEGKRLEREFKFPDFKQALHFTNEVGAVAEAEGHHPDILLAWGKVHLTLWTHASGGLTENDFILAAKIDKLIPEM